MSELSIKKMLEIATNIAPETKKGNEAKSGRSVGVFGGNGAPLPVASRH
jgi:hypothetical protein